MALEDLGDFFREDIERESHDVEVIAADALDERPTCCLDTIPSRLVPANNFTSTENTGWMDHILTLFTDIQSIEL